MAVMMYVDDDLPRPPGEPPAEGQNWDCVAWGMWPLTFPWTDAAWGMWRLS
jgi:hypothetical protein